MMDVDFSYDELAQMIDRLQLAAGLCSFHENMPFAKEQMLVAIREIVEVIAKRVLEEYV